MAPAEELDGVGVKQGEGNGPGFVAGATNSGLASMMPGQAPSRYLVVGLEEENGVGPRSSENGRANREPFEVELLSDIEGSPDLQTSRSSIEERVWTVDDDDERMRNIWATPNRAIVMSYFCVGFAMRFLTMPTSYYMVAMGAEPGQQNTVLILASLPWSFKLVFGFISDNFPIGGMRRKPYFIMGWAVYGMVNLFIATSEHPSIQLLAGGLFISTLGYVLADVTTDAIVVERSKNEPKENRGSMQAVGYSVRFAGSVLGSTLGLVLYRPGDGGFGLSIQGCFLLNGLFPFAIVGPWVLALRETEMVRQVEQDVGERLRTQSREVFRTLEQKAVYGPMAMIFAYNIMQVPNAAWKSFLIEGLDFSTTELGILGIVGTSMASLGLVVYKRWFFHTSWRKIYIWATLIITFFSLFQLLLIFRVNVRLGIKDLIFSLGDDSIQDFVTSIQFLPAVQMYISMCPDGAEGTTYAILTTMSNVSGAAAFSIGTLLTKIWDVTNAAFKAQNFTGMWKLTLLTSLLQPIPLVLIRRLPKNHAEQRALQGSGIRNPIGGIILLTVLFTSLFVTVVQSVWELLA